MFTIMIFIKNSLVSLQFHFHQAKNIFSNLLIGPCRFIQVGVVPIFDVICIKGSTEWYHVKSASDDLLDIDSIDSSNILITIMRYGITRLSQCKVFYLCNSNFKINGTSET